MQEAVMLSGNSDDMYSETEECNKLVTDALKPTFAHESNTDHDYVAVEGDSILCRLSRLTLKPLITGPLHNWLCLLLVLTGSGVVHGADAGSSSCSRSSAIHCSGSRFLEVPCARVEGYHRVLYKRDCGSGSRREVALEESADAYSLAVLPGEVTPSDVILECVHKPDLSSPARLTDGIAHPSSELFSIESDPLFEDSCIISRLVCDRFSANINISLSYPHCCSMCGGPVIVSTLAMSKAPAETQELKGSSIHTAAPTLKLGSEMATVRTTTNTSSSVQGSSSSSSIGLELTLGLLFSLLFILIVFVILCVRYRLTRSKLISKSFRPTLRPQDGTNLVPSHTPVLPITPYTAFVRSSKPIPKLTKDGSNALSVHTPVLPSTPVVDIAANYIDYVPSSKPTPTISSRPRSTDCATGIPEHTAVRSSTPGLAEGDNGSRYDINTLQYCHAYVSGSEKEDSAVRHPSSPPIRLPILYSRQASLQAGQDRCTTSPSPCNASSTVSPYSRSEVFQQANEVSGRLSLHYPQYPDHGCTADATVNRSIVPELSQ
eukprot:scpid86115/ scgid19145/ 